MNDAIKELKLRAGLVKKAIERREPRALRRLARLRGGAPERVQHKHCLDLVAQEFGFTSFSHARDVLSDEGACRDFGTLLEIDASQGLLNHWFAQYEEAREFREKNGGYLLGYRTQMLVVGTPYIEALRLDPVDPDWAQMGFDWIRPASTKARSRLYAKLLAAKPKELAA